MNKCKRAFEVLLVCLVMICGFGGNDLLAEPDGDPPYGASKSYVFTYDELDDPALTKLYGEEETDSSFPKRFCLSEKMALAVEDQGTTELCDLYANVKCIETNYALSHGSSLDLSETYLDYLSSKYFYGAREPGTLSDGSTMFYAARFGAALEKDIPKGDYAENLSAITMAEPACVVTATIDFTDLTSAGQIAPRLLWIIKNHLMQYGSLATDIHSPDLSAGDAYQPDHYAYYYSESVFGEELRPSHHISIVGYDDTYPKENFAVTPEHDGAFLCLNSWGTDFGDSGIFYVSYETLNAFEMLNGVLATEPYCPVTEYTYAESNDFEGEIINATKTDNFYGVIYRTKATDNDAKQEDTNQKDRNQEDQKQNEFLKRICLKLTANPGIVRIYCNPQAGCFEEEQMVCLGETAISFWGDTLLDLTEPLKLNGEEFALVFEVEYAKRMNEDFICNYPSKSKETHEILAGHFYNSAGFDEAFSLMDYDLLLYVQTVSDNSNGDGLSDENSDAVNDDGLSENRIDDDRNKVNVKEEDSRRKGSGSDEQINARLVRYICLTAAVVVLMAGGTYLLIKKRS